MLHTKRECRNNVRHPWSKEINKIMTQVHILQIHLSSLWNNIDCHVQIEAKQNSLKINQYLPDSIKDTIKLFKSIQKDVQTICKEYWSKRTTLMKDQKGAYVESRSNVCPRQEARCFKRLQIASAIFSKLPTKKHKGSGLTFPSQQSALNSNTRQSLTQN